jgi:hypothetical protein
VDKYLPLAAVALYLATTGTWAGSALLGALHSTTTLDFSYIYPLTYLFIYLSREVGEYYFLFQSICQATVQQPNLEFRRIASTNTQLAFIFLFIHNIIERQYLMAGFVYYCYIYIYRHPVSIACTTVEPEDFPSIQSTYLPS